MRVGGWAVFALALVGATGCRESVRGHVAKAKDALYAQQPQQALNEYLAGKELLDRDSSAESAVWRARVLRGAGDIYYLELHDFKNAVGVYRELIRLCPEAPETLQGRLHLADLLRVQYGDSRGAIAELTAALERNPPESAELKYKVAKLYFELGDYEQAHLEARALSARYETSAYVDDALLLAGQALSMGGAKGEAMRTFEEVPRRFPDSELAPFAHFEIGRLREEAGQNELAIQSWVDALKRHPNPGTVQSAIGRVRTRMVLTAPSSSRDEAFDHGARSLSGRTPPKPILIAAPRNSVEAAGGTAEEAAREHGGD